MNKVEHVCYCCGHKSTDTYHIELGLYQCTDIDACMNTAITNGKMMQVDIADDDIPDWFNTIQLSIPQEEYDKYCEELIRLHPSGYEMEVK